MTPGGNRSGVEALLRRIEELVSDLEQLSDPVAREPARHLLQTVLDLHSLALARTVALVAQAERGPELLQQLGRDEQVRAVLLLHGLHPEDVEARVRAAVGSLQPAMRDQGLQIGLLGVTRRSARLHIAGRDPGDVAALRQEIEAALLEAAPELEAIDLQFEDRHENRPAAFATPLG